MGQSTEHQSRNQRRIEPLYAAVLIYALVCVPVYFWLEGPVSGAGVVDGSIAIAGLLLGSILFVPLIERQVERRFGRTGRVRTGMEENE